MPKSLGKPAETAKMQLGEPKQGLVGKMVSGIEEEEAVKRLWERKIDPGDSPHQNKEKTPKSERAVQVPADSRKMCSPVHGQAATPIPNSRPPYNGSRQTKARHTDCANALH